MIEILQNIAGNVMAAIILSIIGIGSVTVIIHTGTHNPRKKWRILMLVSIVAFVISGTTTTTYPGGFAHTSDFGKALEWLFGSLFVAGLFGSWVNK